MIYLRLNESNQIVTCDQATGQIQTMDSMYTVAWVENNEIKIWGTSDDAGFIDSVKYHYPDASLPLSSDIEEEQLPTQVTNAVRFVEERGCRVYKNDQQL
jgi:hypothetical protein